MDKNLAFYLKYRPQRLSEVIGQEAVKQTITNAFKEKRLSHAYLFVGSRGTGKTSTARILAKMVNCRKSEAGNQKSDDKIPCNQCDLCQSITDGSNLDLIEIDAASNRGIDDIRTLRERIKLAPTSSKKKVYIIDEVHMLTQEAFNALLKTLEEPPKHALFILATTEGQKVPPTIMSRSTRLDFSLATPDQLREALDKIIKAEKIDIDEEALQILIKKADGSFRDGVKILDQVAAKNGKITASDILENFRSISFENVEVLIQNLSDRKTSQSLMEVQKLREGGVDMKEIMLYLMDFLRNIVFIKNGLGERLVKNDLTADKYEQLIKISDKLSNQDLVRSLDILQGSLEKLKFASIPSLPLELAILEICGDETNKTLDNRNLKLDSSIKLPASKPDEITTSEDILKLKEKWNFVLETIRPYNFSLEALLRSVRLSSITDSTVVMEVPYSFHQRILDAPKNKDILEGVLSDVLGRQIKVSCVLGSRPIQREDLANIEVAQDDEIVRIASEIFNSDSIN